MTAPCGDSTQHVGDLLGVGPTERSVHRQAQRELFELVGIGQIVRVPIVIMVVVVHGPIVTAGCHTAPGVSVGQ